MYSEERYRIIIDIINEKGKVTVKELADKFGVSKVTIRRDLDLLNEREVISRTFGGAIQKNSILKEYSLSERERLNIDAKRAIAKEAVTLINDGMVIYMDSGTTTKIMITIFKEFNELSIVTSDIIIAHELSNFENIKVILLGGELDKDILSTNSGVTLNSVSNLYFDICFIGCDGFDNTNAYASSETRALIKNKVISQSRSRILLADSSKFNNKNMYIISNLDNIDLVISDSKDTALQNSLTTTKLNVIDLTKKE